jgi:protein TonB
MKTNVRLLICLLVALTFTINAVSAQQKPTKQVYENVDEVPTFEGGMPKLIDFLVANIKYPKEAAQKKIEGKVLVKMIVQEDGSIGEVEVIKGHDELNAEALRVVKMMPKWKPAKVNGKAVAASLTMPIMFKLS